MMRSGVRTMHLDGRKMILVLFSILLVVSYGTAQEAEQQEHGAPAEHEAHEEEHAEEAEHEDHGEEHGGRPHHMNEAAIFLGATAEHGHPTEFTMGFDYRRRIAGRWAVGGLFDYAGGDLRNAIFAASLTWFPIGKLSLMAAPGIEFHRGRGPTLSCGCDGTFKSEDSDPSGLIDEDARYFVFRVGAGWDFQIGKNYGIQPQFNIDFVDDEKVYVYGFNFTYAW